MNRNVRKITDGAMMLAVIGVFLLLNRQLGGMFTGSFLYLMPLPMVFYSTKYGMKDSWVVFAGMCLMTLVLGTPQSLFYMAAEGLIGLVYGSGIHNKKDTGRLLVKTILIGIVTELLAMVVFAGFFGYDLAAEMAEYKEMIDLMSTQTNMQLDAMVNIDQFLMEILILSTIMIGILEVIATHIISRFMLHRLGFHVEKAKPLTSYELPRWTGYVGFAGFVAYYLSIYRPLDNTILQMTLQGFGMAGVYYLVIAGIAGVMKIIRFHNPKASRLFVLPIVLLALIMNIWCAVWGFLYLTTDLKDRFMQSGSR